MTTQAWDWSALDAQNQAQSFADAKAMTDRQNSEMRRRKGIEGHLRISVGQLWLRGMCTPWSGLYHCSRDLWWRTHDEPSTPVCPICGQMMLDVLL